MKTSDVLSLPLIFLCLFSCFRPFDGHASPIAQSCTTTREYIITLEYLRRQNSLALPEPQARTTAREVSQGCTGSAQRFIKITTALRDAGVTAQGAIRTGIEFASKTDVETETFLTVFLNSFLEDALDLDLGASLTLARALSTEFRGDTLGVRNDFEMFVRFCVSTDALNLSRPQCGPFAARLARQGEKFSGGVASPFIRAFQFLRSEAGPGLTTGQALHTAETLIQGGRDSADNFIQAFDYGASPDGLQLPTAEAIQFASQMALPRHTKN